MLRIMNNLNFYAQCKNNIQSHILSVQPTKEKVNNINWAIYMKKG